ncbi:MAG: lipid II flippase MurJ, partial [Patescibacteria group bacterium]
TIIQFAYNLNFFPIGVIAVSFAIAAFPTLCDLSNRRDQTGFIQTFSTTVRQILFFVIPATFIFILLRAQIVRVVLGAGEFDWQATIATADTLGFFAISFFAQALVFILIRAYFAYHDTLTPFIVGLVAAAINIIAALLLTLKFGVQGLGVAFSLAAIIQVILLWVPLRQRIGTLDEWRIIRSFAILTIAGFAGALTTQVMKTIVVNFITLDTFFGVLLQGLIAGTIGLIVYGTIAYFFKSEEMIEFIKGMKRRLFKKAKPEETIVTTLSQ